MIESIKKDKWIKKVRKIFLVIIIVLLFGIGVYYGDINKKYVEIVEDMERYVASNVQNNTEIERVDLIREYAYANSVFAINENLLLNGFSKEIFGVTKKEKIVKMFNLTSNFGGDCLKTQ